MSSQALNLMKALSLLTVLSAFVASLNNTVIQTLDSLELVDTLTIEGVTGEYLQGELMEQA